MRIRTIPWAILRMQYRLGRVPVRLVAEQLIARMGPDAPVRLLFERAIGAMDATVGIVLGDGALEDEGVARIERAAELEEAAHLDEMALRRLRQADAELRRRRDEARIDQRRIDKRADERIEDADTEPRRAVRTGQS